MILDGVHQQVQATLHELLLAGGKSVRMNGVDKNVLVYHRFPQLVHSYEILDSLCSHSFISIQYSHVHYQEFSQIIDTLDIGPMGGLHETFSRFPHYAWLALAVDMPMVTTDILSHLISERDSHMMPLYIAPQKVLSLCAPSMSQVS